MVPGRSTYGVIARAAMLLLLLLLVGLALAWLLLGVALEALLALGLQGGGVITILALAAAGINLLLGSTSKGREDGY